ncbi:MAG: hypothetical protein RI958_2293 [Actinomycetota bacterium]|jgi:hypothetical protein
MFVAACSDPEQPAGSDNTSGGSASGTVPSQDPPAGERDAAWGAARFEELPPIDRQVLARLGLDYGDDLARINYSVRSALMTDCMALRGFEFDRGPSPESLDPVGHRTWHPLDREYAEMYGYQAAPRVPSPMNDRANADPAFSEALFGSDGSPGCFELVARYVEETTGAESLADDVSRLRNDPLTRMSGWVTTDEYKRLVDEWSTCMAQRGYTFGSPDDALSTSGEGGDPSDAEVATRLADINCDTAVGLTAERSEFETQVAEQWADENAEAVSEMRSRIAAVTERLVDLQESDPVWAE